jgi:hypothetical protein
MSEHEPSSEGRAVLLSTLLAISIVLAILAAVVALAWQPGEGLRETAAALGAAALVHLCAAFAIEWTRRLG